ncbi:MAG: hypothetical protein JEY96_01570 [Bacteroidales bacterium]|nr:hypothetical protein [Bacteroidales bacterium]
MLHETEVNAEIKKHGRPDKIYIGDPDLRSEVGKLTDGEVIVNPKRYKDKTVFKYGHKMHEIKGKKQPQPNTTK